MILPRRLKFPLLLLALLFGFSGIQLAVGSLTPESVTRKDFIQEYLMARAVVAGVNPYLLLPDLNERFQTGASWVFPHPTPHTPSLAIFSLPFAFLNYARAASVWLLIEILCLSASVLLLLRWFNPSINPLFVIPVAWAFLGWSHVWEDLVLGQINALLLFLIIGAWLNLRNGRQALGGALLGTAISFKLILWPFVLLLIFCRRWLSVTMALTIFALTNLIAAATIGWRIVADYYVDVGPSTAALYRACGQNLSLWSVGWRVFTGTGSPAMIGVEAPPIFFSSRLAVITSILLTCAALILGLAASVKVAKVGKAGAVGNFDFAYGMMICACLLVSPLTWPHYLILTAIPVAVVTYRLQGLRFPRRETVLFTIAAVILLIPSVSLDGFISSLSISPSAFSNDTGVQLNTPVSFAAGLLSLLPTLSILILLWLMRQLSRMAVESHLKPE